MKKFFLQDLKSAHVIPQGRDELQRLLSLARSREAFTFVRFSDGELEVIRNRSMSISNGVTEFRGRFFKNNFPEYDQKKFVPERCQDLRSDLISSAIYRTDFYFKGIPTSHNNAVIDREFMLRLNGGFSTEMTFSDLFMNSNFILARDNFFPSIIGEFDNVIVVGNWRCELRGYLRNAELIQIPDDIFSSYQKTLDSVQTALQVAPNNALILSSASSLSNVLGHRLRISRPDLTFIDIGTALNDLLGLPLGTRAYHKLIAPHTIRERFLAWRYKQHPEYKIRW